MSNVGQDGILRTGRRLALLTGLQWLGGGIRDPAAGPATCPTKESNLTVTNLGLIPVKGGIYWSCAVVSAGLVATALLASAQPPEQPAEEAVRVPPQREFRLPPRIGIITDMPLTLEDALRMALANNRNVDVSRIAQEQAGYGIDNALGAFDPLLTAASSYQRNVQPIASSLGGSATGAVTNGTTLWNPQIGGSLPFYGGSYGINFSNQRTTTNNSFTQLNPTYPTSLNFSYTQPLWRNLFYDLNRRGVEVAKKNQSLTDEQFRQTVMETVTQAEQAYWNLAFAYNNLEIQLDAVAAGSEQDQSNRRQEREGLLAPIDVVAAQRQLATFEVNAYSAQEALTNAENTLKTLILGDRGDPLWSMAIIPVTPVNVSPPIVPLADAIDQALRSRPELAQLRISQEINDADQRLGREQIKPQINLVVSHTNAGLAGATLPPSPNPFTAGFAGITARLNELSTMAGLDPIPDISTGGGNPLPSLLVGNYGQSLSNLFTGNFPTTQVGVQISLPFKNRSAEATLRTAIADGRRIQSQRAQVEQAIEAGVRNAMQSIESARARLESAQVARESAEQQYESEQRQFRAGTSTLFLVQQRQTDMVTARSQESRAEADLGIAIAAFEFATGQILESRNIQIQ